MDLEAEREVSYEEAIDLGKRLGISAVFEASAKKNSNIEDIFFRALSNCIDYYGLQQNEKDRERENSFDGSGSRMSMGSMGERRLRGGAGLDSISE